mgnify:CR=1 FL=1
MKRALAVLMIVCLLSLGAAAQEQQAYPVLGLGARGDEVARLQGY